LQLAKGRADLGFYWNLILFFIIPMTVYIGSYWELLGIVYSLLGLQFILFFPGWKFLIKPLCGAGFKEYSLQILKPLIYSIVGGIFAYEWSLLFGIKNIYLSAVFIAVVMGIIVILLNVWFNREFVATVFELFGKRKKN